MADSAREIENLLYTYAERMDAGNLEGVADLFAHGRVKSGPEANAAVFEGCEEVLRLYRGSARLYEDASPRTKHVTTNAIVEVAADDRTASARSYYTVFQRTDDLPLQPIICGRYHDTFHRVEGSWTFDDRIMFVDLVGDLSHHLLYDLRKAAPKG